jgi:multidrug efflux pump subunit AcrA (membrane-fusion protein)
MQVAILGKDNRVELRPVKLGRNLGTDVEVVSGLTPQDRVIESPPDSLSTGDLVRAVDNAPAGEDGRLAAKQAAAGASKATP